MIDWITTEDLQSLIKPGNTVYVGGSVVEPYGLLNQLNFGSYLNFIQQPIAAVNQRDLSALGDGCNQETYFITPFLKTGLLALPASQPKTRQTAAAHDLPPLMWSKLNVVYQTSIIELQQ